MSESSPASPPQSPLANVGSAAGDLLLAGLFLVTWIAPESQFALPLRAAMLTMLLEFVVVHSTAFMGNVALRTDSRHRRATAIVGLGGFYTLFVGGFALAFRTWQPLMSFWGLTLNRSLGVLLDPAPTERQELRIRKGY